MKDIPIKISLTDFLGYFFPGLIFVLSIVSFTYSFGLVISFEVNFFVGLILLAISYMLGILSSALISLFRLNEKWDNISESLNQKDLKSFLPEIKSLFKVYLKKDGEWSNENYLMIRAAVRELSPQATEFAERQNSLRQFKRNSIIPMIFLCLSGINWGIKFAISNGSIFYLLISIVSLLLSILLPKALKIGMQRNRRLEVRDYCFSFIHLMKYSHKT